MDYVPDAGTNMRSIIGNIYYYGLFNSNKYIRINGFYFTMVYKQVIPFIGIYTLIREV